MTYHRTRARWHSQGPLWTVGNVRHPKCIQRGHLFPWCTSSKWLSTCVALLLGFVWSLCFRMRWLVRYSFQGQKRQWMANTCWRLSKDWKCSCCTPHFSGHSCIFASGDWFLEGGHSLKSDLPSHLHRSICRAWTLYLCLKGFWFLFSKHLGRHLKHLEQVEGWNQKSWWSLARCFCWILQRIHLLEYAPR